MMRPILTEHDLAARLNWLYLDMNSYFASVEQQDNPHLRGKPVIVVPVTSEYTSAIAASREAKKAGIRTGTQVREARRLCPSVAVIEARPDRYVAIHHSILAQIDQVIPIDRVCSIDEVACRLLGSGRHEGMAQQIGRRIQQRILDHVGECLTASVGIAPSRLLAKIASDIEKPLGLTVLRQDTLPGRLLELDLQDLLGIGPAMLCRLVRAGVPDVETLFSQSPSRLRQIWGGLPGDHFWYALHGIDPPETVTERHSISHSHVLAMQLRPADAARMVARRLTAKCGSRLRRMGYRCTSLGLSLRGEPDGRSAADIRFLQTADSFLLLRQMEVLWAECLTKLNRARIKKISVVCAGLLPEDQPKDLFGWAASTDDNAHHMQVLGALDRLNQKFGKDTITIGPRPIVHAFVGAKIAFNRIPEESEFSE